MSRGIKTLLVGPAGSGKTHRLLDEFVETLQSSADPLAEDYFFILPSSEHVDRVITLILQRGLKGFFFRRITTLSALIQDVFSVPDQPVISQAVRAMILKDILAGQRWDYFEEVQQSPGFLGLIENFLMELKDSLITPEDFRQRMNALKLLEPDIAAKYEALAAMFELYQNRLNQEGLIDRQDLLAVYRQKRSARGLREHRFKKLWLDGFFDFTPLQLEYIREFSAVSDEVVITLTKDDGFARPQLFEAVRQTEDCLKNFGFRIVKQPKNFEIAFPALSFVERCLFSGSGAAESPDPSGSLAIFEAVGIQGEIEMIAREIIRLCRFEGMRFSDCAVLLRQIGRYDPVIHSVFSRHQIPAEIHERERLELSPMIQTVLSLLKIFLDDWKRSDLLNFLRSSYVRRMGSEEKSLLWVGELEHAALRLGVARGRENWLKLSDHPMLKVLAESEDSLKSSRIFLQTKRSLLNRLRDFGLFDLPDTEDEVCRRDAATLRRLEAILEEIGHHLSLRRQSEITFEAFAEDFFRLTDLDLYSLHHRDKNRVQIYDISLARQKEYKAVFVAGLLEKSFPVLIKEDPILSDWERRLINAHSERPLAERLPRQHLERYLFYLAVTRAREKLYLTYPRLDRDGKESLPSFYVDEIQTLFAGTVPVKKQNPGQPYPDPREAVNLAELEAGVMGALWHAPKEDEPLLLYLANRLLENAESRELFRRYFYGVCAQLKDSEIARLEPFSVSKTSATKLEEYAACPFKFFSHRAVKLQDPEEDFNAMRKGSVMHQVLERFFREWIAAASRFLDEKNISAFIDRELEAGLKDYPLIFEKSYQHELARETIKEMLEEFIRFELERLEASPLEPAYLEFNFGVGKEADAPAFEIQAAGQAVQVTGKIDRIDLDRSRKFGLVIDYKSSAGFSPKKLELGTSLQLPIYLSVIQKFLKLKPVGGELYSIRDIKKQGFYHEENAEGLLKLSPRSARYADTDFQALTDRSLKFAGHFIQGMRQMNISVRPRECSPACPYPSVCRIEKWRLETIVEEIREEDKKWI